MAVSIAAIRDFGNEVVAEVKKVTWPDWPQLRNSTAVIIVFVFIVSAIIWVMDLGVRLVIQDFILGVFAR